MSAIDISMPLSAAVATWPGSAGFAITRNLDIAQGDPVNNSVITLDAQTGTHVDAPRHLFPDGSELEDLGLALLEGPVLDDVDPGRHLHLCLPLRLQGAEASPVRAILLEELPSL